MHKVRLGNLLVRHSLKICANFIIHRLSDFYNEYHHILSVSTKSFRNTPDKDLHCLVASLLSTSGWNKPRELLKGPGLCYLFLHLFDWNLFPFWLALPNNPCVCSTSTGIDKGRVKETKQRELERCFRECGEWGKHNGKEHSCCDLRRVVHVSMEQNTGRELMELVYSLRGINLSMLEILTTFFKAWNGLVLISEQGLAAHTAAGLDNY